MIYIYIIKYKENVWEDELTVWDNELTVGNNELNMCHIVQDLLRDRDMWEGLEKPYEWVSQ